MKFSAFSTLGHFAFSAKPPKGQVIFESMRDSLGGNYSEDFDGLEMARLYAQAMCMASALYTLERAGNNANPRKATELLAELEREYGLVPGPKATLGERRAELAARRILPRGAMREHVEDALQTLLGADFVEYRHGDVVLAGGAGVGNFVKADAPVKLIKIVTGISTGLGAPKVVTYAALEDGAELPDLLPGEVLVVDPGGLTEAVVVEARAGNTFTGTFLKPHDPNTVATTQPMPIWSTDSRRNLAVLSSAAAADPEIRRRVDAVLRRILRGVSTWQIADSSGPFKVNNGKIGITTIGAL